MLAGEYSGGQNLVYGGTELGPKFATLNILFSSSPNCFVNLFCFQYKVPMQFRLTSNS